MGNIRSFSKSDDRFELEPHDLSESLEKALMLAHNALKYRITVHKEWDNCLPLRCDINSLRQMFLNLILNAVQAMDGVGELWITGRKKDGNIVVSIKDSGPGIPEAAKERIFEAFYSTKPDGTGLGLAIVKRIVNKHNGTNRVESECGKGATFYICLP
ncbi:MAG TPA: HAMP domain-containing histidine kinase, partial [Desulfobacterales bacterium]|nr:HAMP domain-containing histidine kinase [Desulfobacterales bacterium]